MRGAKPARSGRSAHSLSRASPRRVQAVRRRPGESCFFVGAAPPPVLSRWTLEFVSVMCSPYLLWRWTLAWKLAAAVGGASAPSAALLGGGGPATASQP
eukprot:7726748-Pyramimonas_sp.AAC.2